VLTGPGKVRKVFAISACRVENIRDHILEPSGYLLAKGLGVGFYRSFFDMDTAKYQVSVN
jgi:hypothetical protein